MSLIAENLFQVSLLVISEIVVLNVEVDDCILGVFTGGEPGSALLCPLDQELSAIPSLKLKMSLL